MALVVDEHPSFSWSKTTIIHYDELYKAIQKMSLIFCLCCSIVVVLAVGA